MGLNALSEVGVRDEKVTTIIRSAAATLEWLESHDRTHLVLLGHLSGFLFGDHTGRLRQC
jgi:hypothetical protein